MDMPIWTYQYSNKKHNYSIKDANQRQGIWKNENAKH